MSSRLEIALPSGFQEIPMDSDPNECTRRANELLAGLPPGSIPDIDAAVSGIVTSSNILQRSGAVIAGQLTLRDQPSTVSAFLVVAVRHLSAEYQPAPKTTRDAVVTALASTMHARKNDEQWEVVTLDTGPALRLIRHLSIELSATETISGHVEIIESRGVQYLIPGPDLREVITLDISTSNVIHWPRFQQLSHTIASSLKLSPEDRT